jgi:hypothetical protein
VVAVLPGGRNGDGPDGTVVDRTAAGELQAATASMPASVAAILRIIGSGY